MDNACHTLCGLALARAGLDRAGPWATAAVVLGANLPDLDILGQPWGGQVYYLCHHRGVTHALLGLVVQAFLLAGVLGGVARLRGGAAPPRGGLLLAAGVGLASHLALDSLNTYGVRPWLPFDGRWYYGDVAFIVDPLLWLALSVAGCLGAPRLGKRSDLGWWFWLGVASGFLALAGRTSGAPDALAPTWGATLLATLVARRLGFAAERRHVAARVALGLGALYLIVLGALGRVALGRAERASAGQGGPLVASVVSPLPGRPWRFRTVLARADRLDELEVDLASGEVEATGSLERHLDDPLLQRVSGRDEAHAWRTFARLPFVARHDGERALVLGDGRYGLVPRPTWCNLRVSVPPTPPPDDAAGQAPPGVGR